MGKFGLYFIHSSVIAQADFFALLSTYLSDHMVFILGGIGFIVALALMLSKKMTAKPANKNFSSKTPTKQGQYKKFK